MIQTGALPRSVSAEREEVITAYAAQHNTKIGNCSEERLEHRQTAKHNKSELMRKLYP